MLAINASLSILFICIQLATAQDDNPCKSFGVDFQDGGIYFQNSLSSEPFTFVSQYEGCLPDTCFNILVDTVGDQVECSDTPLQPDDTPQMSTCPTLKNQLISGAWSVIMISNNGDAESIAYQRDFNLTVGPQQTTTFTPTVTVFETSSAVIDATSTVYDFPSNVTLPVQTVYAPSVVVKTKTITPKRVLTTTTSTIKTVDRVRPTVIVSETTEYITASCTVPPRQSTRDPICRIRPTVGGDHGPQIQDIATKAVPALATALGGFDRIGRKSKPGRGDGNGGGGGGKSRRSIKDRRAALPGWDKEQFLRHRNERLAARALEKRSPDEETITVTATNTADFKTTTSTIPAPTTLTNTIEITLTSTGTVTPPPVTVVSGRTRGPPTTVTAPTPTKTVTRYTVATGAEQRTSTTVVTITSVTTPAAVNSACRKRGGHFRGGRGGRG